MAIWELVIISFGLSMDAFAVAVCKGLSLDKVNKKDALAVGLYFGIFQAAMPVIGYIGAEFFSSFIQSWDHWIAFILLGFIGIKMIIEALKNRGCDAVAAKDDKKLVSAKSMIPLAIATSIDALVVGITFAFLSVNILYSAGLIGIITFTMSVIAVYIGNYFGCIFKTGAEITGGVILILMGIKILITHLGAEIISLSM